MQLFINGESVKSFCPDKAVSSWMFSGKGSRHLGHKTIAKTKSREVETDAQEEKADEGDAMSSTSSVTSVDISDSESDRLIHVFSSVRTKYLFALMILI